MDRVSAIKIYYYYYYVSTDIEDRNIIADVCDLYQRSNLLISDFRVHVCDNITLDSLHKIYCMHMYVCNKDILYYYY